MVIIWSVFLVLSIILIFRRINKGMERSIVSLVLNILNCVISFVIARVLVNFLAKKCGKEVILLAAKNVNKDFSHLSSIEGFGTFIGSILLSVAAFYIVYILISIIFFIIKHIFIYSKIKKENEETNFGKKGVIVGLNIVSVIVTMVVLVTPIGIAYNWISALRTDSKEEEKLPFVSTAYFNKLTETPDNKDKVKTVDEITWSLKTFRDLQKLEDGGNLAETNIDVNISKTYFLPTIMADLGSTGATFWKNGEEFMTIKFDIPSGREGKLVLSILDILEKWKKENVVQDVEAMVYISDIISDYKSNDSDAEKGERVAELFSNQEFMESLFVKLYHSEDFAELIPRVIEYSLGTTFDYVGLELDKNYSSSLDISKLSEEDIRREARIIAGIIKTVLEVYDTSQKFQNGEFTAQDIEKIIDEVSKLKDSKIFGDLANEIVLQLTNSIENIGIEF